MQEEIETQASATLQATIPRFDSLSQDRGLFERLTAELRIVCHRYASSRILEVVPLEHISQDVKPGQWCTQAQYQARGKVEYGFDAHNQNIWELWTKPVATFVRTFEDDLITEYKFDSRHMLFRLRRITLKAGKVQHSVEFNAMDESLLQVFTYDTRGRIAEVRTTWGTRQKAVTGQPRTIKIDYEPSSGPVAYDRYGDDEPKVRPLAPAQFDPKKSVKPIASLIADALPGQLVDTDVIFLAYDPGAGLGSLTLGQASFSEVQARAQGADLHSLWNPAEYPRYDNPCDPLQLAVLTAGSQHMDDLAQQSFLEQTAKQLQKTLATLTERQLLVVATDFNTTYLERGLMAALKPAQKTELTKQGLLPG